jgi:hypothetical protein
MAWQKIGNNLNQICDSGNFETLASAWGQPSPAGDSAYFYTRTTKIVKIGYGGEVNLNSSSLNNRYPLFQFNAEAGKKYIAELWLKTSETNPISIGPDDRIRLISPSNLTNDDVISEFPPVEVLISDLKTNTIKVQQAFTAFKTISSVVEARLVDSSGDLVDGALYGELYFDLANVFEIQDIAACTINIDNVSITDANGADNGAITVTASGATNIEYRLDSGAWQASNIFANLAAGTYNVQVRDADETTCQASTTAIVNFVSYGTGAITAINEDGVLMKSVFSVDTTKNVVINSLKVKLLAYNEITGASFELDAYNVDVSASPDGKLFNVNTTRGYKLASGDKFNRVKFITSSLVGTDQYYELEIGQKIKWQDWILNPNADPVFLDETKPNGNLNYKSSNYSNIFDYVIKVAVIVNVTGNDAIGRRISGDAIQLGGTVTVQEYKESGDVFGTIQTIDQETGTPLGGAVLYNGKDTLFRATFNNYNAVSYAILRIEPVNNTGDGIFELSSLRLPPSGNLLKPLEGESYLKVYQAGSNIVAECLIDGNLIEDNVNYKLSARIEDAIAIEDYNADDYSPADYK